MPDVKDKVTRILNSSLTTKGYNRIAKEAGVAESFAMKVLKDFPLWNYVRNQNKDGRCK